MRTFIMKGVKRADLPHLLTVPLSNERGGDVAELLVTVAGRKPLCLRCRRVGHIRRACTTPYCRRHGVYGHSTEECDGTVASYSRAARPRTEPEVVEEAPAGTIPGEEEETAAEVDTPAIVSVQANVGVTSAVQPAFVPPCAAAANSDWPATEQRLAAFDGCKRPASRQCSARQCKTGQWRSGERQPGRLVGIVCRRLQEPV